MAKWPENCLANMVDPSGTTKYTYTPAGQLLTEDGPFGERRKGN
jgi:YD repeat-containing protein